MTPLSDPSPRISVVICTRNRSDHLRRALAGVAEQTLSRDAFETIVVDNASTDDTKSVADAFAQPANTRYLFEPVVGLCHARNAGWRAARGAYVAYLDDDAIPEPRWLAETLDAFETVRPQPGCVGGRVSPLYEAPRPGWLSDEASRALTIVDWPNGPHAIADLRQEWLVGANIAFRRLLLDTLGGFPTTLGRIGKRLLSGEDVYLQRLVMEAGHSCYYQPAASVRHFVPVARMDRRWFAQRYYWQGVSDAVMEILHDRPSPAACRLEGLRRALRILRSPRQLALLILPTRDPARFTRKCWALIALGHAVGLLHGRP